MRFALPASKFEGLQLCHQFFYDLMNLLEALCLNVAKEEVKKISKKILKAFVPKNHQKLYKSLPQQMAALIQSQGTTPNY